MLNQLLANALIEDGLLTFLLGMLVTFSGILVIVISVKIFGGFFAKSNASKPKEEKVIEESKPITTNNEIPEHVKVAIVAAITAYYYENENKSKSDFIVRRIKRI